MWPAPFVAGQSLRRALQVMHGVGPTKDERAVRRLIVSITFAKKSALGAALATIHALVFAFVIFSPPPDPPCQPCDPASPGMCVDPCSFCCLTYVAGRSFHNEFAFKLLVFGDLPAAFLASVIMEGTYPMLLGRSPQNTLGGDSYPFAVLWLSLGTIQWGLIGAAAASKLLVQRKNEVE